MRTLYQIEQIKEPVVLTTGMFDGVHSGHRYLLNELNEIGRENNCKTVVISFLNHPRWVVNNNEYPPVLLTPDEKVDILEELGIDYLLLLDFKDYNGMPTEEYLKIIKTKINMKFLLMGYNNTIGSDKIKSPLEFEKLSDKYQFKTIFSKPFIFKDSRISSTIIRNHLLNGDLKLANDYLGYCYFLKGKVIKGDQIGRKLGFPTANISPEIKGKLIPKTGVYLCKVELEGKNYFSLLNVGTRPTINSLGKLSIEAHILEFKGDIYNKCIKISFIERIREEKYFHSQQELIEEIEKDKNFALKKISQMK